MTLIIGFAQLIVTDTVTVYDGTPTRGRKVHTLDDGTVFAVAGRQPTLAMLKSTTQAQLFESMALSSEYFNTSSMVSLGPDGLVLSQSNGESTKIDHVFCDDIVFAGSYRQEAINRVLKHTELSSRVSAAVRVCLEVNNLWGVDGPPDTFSFPGARQIDFGGG